jgi:hypothetical protein
VGVAGVLLRKGVVYILIWPRSNYFRPAMRKITRLGPDPSD